ncbi:MAG: hypothetical protein WDW36_001546 [Sanguina aurantia]
MKRVRRCASQLNSFLDPETQKHLEPGVSRSALALGLGYSNIIRAGNDQEWVALLANADFWFNDVQNESVAEQLRERVRFFKEIGRPVDFYFVPEPAWLASKFPAQSAQVRRPCVALMSSDKVWITFMKLRLDRVLRVDLGDMPEAEALKAAGTIPETFTASTKWTAPYGPYAPGWWNVFLPKL